MQGQGEIDDHPQNVVEEDEAPAVANTARPAAMLLTCCDGRTFSTPRDMPVHDPSSLSLRFVDCLRDDDEAEASDCSAGRGRPLVAAIARLLWLELLKEAGSVEGATTALLASLRELWRWW